MTNNDQPINLSAAEREALKSIAQKIDNKKRQSNQTDGNGDRNDSNDFDNGVRLG